MPTIGAASVTGGEVSIRAPKSPVAMTNETANIENVRLVIIPSCAIGCPIPIRGECASLIFRALCAGAHGIQVRRRGAFLASEKAAHALFRVGRGRRLAGPV